MKIKPLKILFVFGSAAALQTMTTSALAQPFAINWSTVDGGGGTSSGGGYSVSGTIGQPDAGVVSSGGVYTMTGGFWSYLKAIQTPGAPSLVIFHPATNAVVISWPSPATGWLLQQNTNSLISVNWSNVTANIQDDGTNKTLIVTPPTGNRFYRLHKP